MRTIKKIKPWLTSTGVEISTEELKTISRSWDQPTWDAYLKWYESPGREMLVQPDLYADLTDRQSKNVFDQFDQDTSDEKRDLCEAMLSSLPNAEAKILRLKFFEGRTEREIAANVGLAKTTMHRRKETGLLRLRREFDGEKWTTRHLMREGNLDSTEIPKSIWARSLSSPIREAKVYEPDQQSDEFKNISMESLKTAIRELSYQQRRIIYLRFWCDYSINEIARDLKCGVNLVEQVLEASISRIKRKILHIEMTSEKNGGPSCA